MFVKLTVVILFLTLSHLVNGQVIKLRRCPVVKYMEKFDLEAYSGIWYEHSKIPCVAEIGQKCISAQYKNLGGNKLGVINSAVDINSNSPVKFEGYANIIGPGRFDSNFGDTKNQIIYEDYAVLGTDYTTWALVHSCKNDGVYFWEYAWILSRNRNATDAEIYPAKNLMIDNSISRDDLRKTDQANCPEI